MKVTIKSSTMTLRVLTLMLMIIPTIQTLVAQDWCNEAWLYRKPVTVPFPSGPSETLLDFQVKITLNTGNFDFTKANEGGSDIRLTASDGITLIPFWIENWTSTEGNIWVKVPNIPTEGTSVYLYYGNTAPTVPSSIPVETPPIGPFARTSMNPISPYGATGTSLLAENIVYDPDSRHYWMCLANYSEEAISLCFSDTPTDPGSWNWGGNVINIPGMLSGAPHLVLYDGIWYLFYSDRPNIMVATSEHVDGPYSVITTPILTPSAPSGAWDSYRVDEPYVFQRSPNEWILIYMGDAGNATEQVGFATAPSILGPYSTSHPNGLINPVIKFGQDPGSIDAGTIADPWVYEYYGVYYIGYTCSPTNTYPWQTAYATTTDWQTFTKRGVLLPVAGWGFDYDNSFRGAITKIGDTYVFSYTGDNFKMGIATQPVHMPPPSIINEPDAVFDFYDSFSGGGLNMTKWSIVNGPEWQADVRGGYLSLTSVNNKIRLFGNTSFSMNYIVETRASHPDQGPVNMSAQLGFSSEYENTVRIVDNYTVQSPYWQRQAKLAAGNNLVINMAQTADPNWHIFRVFRQGSNIAGYQIDNNAIETTIENVPTRVLPPFLMSTSESSQNTFIIDWIRVRKWIGSDPVPEVGNDQARLVNQWTGNVSPNWNTSANWSLNTVPTYAMDVIISSSSSQPAITDAPNASCNNLTINAGASLTINTGQALTVRGNLTNTGTLNLLSDANGIASLILHSYVDDGIENIQLFLTGEGNETNYPWHYISSPVALLSTDVFTVLSDNNPNPTMDLAGYYETRGTPGDNITGAWHSYDGWDYTNEADNNIETFDHLEVGRGYNYYNTVPFTTITFGGSLNTADIVPVTRLLDYSGMVQDDPTKGWNLLGNPFTSSLDWEAIADAITFPTSVDKAIYFTVNNGFASYVPGNGTDPGVGTPESTTANIPPMQGFFIKANTTGQYITLPSSARAHSTQNRYKKGEVESIPLIRMKIESQSLSDEAVIRFDEKATSNFDSQLDAYKFSKSQTHLSLWTLNEPVSYSINSIPFPETTTEVPIGVNISESGTYKLTASQLQGISKYNIFLTDKTTGITINPRTTPSLSFSSSKGMIEDRFVLRITNILANAENTVIFNVYPSNEMIHIQTLSDEWDGKQGSIELIDMTGRVISLTDNAEFWKYSLVKIPIAGYHKGIYFVKIQSGLMRYVGKVGL